jgi:predicted RNA-binding Zn-ribbon protein involved in translation (DUF1610 family)
MRKRYLLKRIDDKTFTDFFYQSKSLTDFAFLLGIINPSGGMYASLKKRLRSLDLKESDQWSLWRQATRPFKRQNDNEYFALNTSHGGAEMRKRICQEKLKPYQCEMCGNEGSWNGQPLILEIDHINGNHFDNRLENLRFLCPNCHSLTTTYDGKNKTQYLESPMAEGNSRKTYLKKKKVCKCKNCGRELTRWAKNDLCLACTNLKKRKVERPTKTEFIGLLKHHSFADLAKMYGISSRAVRKWCQSYEIPSSLNEIRKCDL